MHSCTTYWALCEPPSILIPESCARSCFLWKPEIATAQKRRNPLSSPRRLLIQSQILTSRQSLDTTQSPPQRAVLLWPERRPQSPPLAAYFVVRGGWRRRGATGSSSLSASPGCESLGTTRCGHGGRGLLPLLTIPVTPSWANSGEQAAKDKQDCSFVDGANDEPSDGQMSEQSKHASRAQELGENNAAIVQLQQTLEQSDASLAFKKNEYNKMIRIVQKFFSYFSPPEKASEAAVSFVMDDGNFGQQVACMQDFLRCFIIDRKFGIKYHRRKKKNLAEPTPN